MKKTIFFKLRQISSLIIPKNFKLLKAKGNFPVLRFPKVNFQNLSIVLANLQFILSYVIRHFCDVINVTWAIYDSISKNKVMCKIRTASDFIAKMTSLKKKCGCDVQARSQNEVFLGKRKFGRAISSRWR